MSVLETAAKIGRRCNTCKELKPLSEFHKRRASADGYGHRCKPCARAITRKWYWENRENAMAASRQYRKENPDKFRAAGQRWRDANKDKRRKTRLEWVYGLTAEQFDAMFEQQGGKCANIGCRVVHTDKRPLQVDHCHESGQIRGLLCRECNLVLGKMQDDINRIEGLSQYLQIAEMFDGVGPVVDGVRRTRSEKVKG